ncbi:MAG: hypothetical protein P8L37_05250 [Phycisphaerales bacterium]|nr:hypothetical protein [Phycisphaerales bacterium]
MGRETYRFKRLDAFRLTSLLEVIAPGSMAWGGLVWPGLGPFESEQVQIQVMVGGAYHQLEVGLLPEMLEGLLTMFQIRGIIGLDILSKQRACIDLESERLWPHVGMKLNVAV